MFCGFCPPAGLTSGPPPALFRGTGSRCTLESLPSGGVHVRVAPGGGPDLFVIDGVGRLAAGRRQDRPGEGGGGGEEEEVRSATRSAERCAGAATGGAGGACGRRRRRAAARRRFWCWVLGVLGGALGRRWVGWVVRWVGGLDALDALCRGGGVGGELRSRGAGSRERWAAAARSKWLPAGALGGARGGRWVRWMRWMGRWVSVGCVGWSVGCVGWSVGWSRQGRPRGQP